MAGISFESPYLTFRIKATATFASVKTENNKKKRAEIVKRKKK